MNNAYVYKWTHLPTFKWYVGVRYGKGCHINDGYICSSKIVKPMIEQNPNDWQRTILEIGSPEKMRELEKEILQTVDAQNDKRSFNRNNSGVPKGWSIPWNKGLSKEQSHRYGKPGGMRNKKQSELQKKVVGLMSKEKNKIQAQCPHCQKTGQMVAMHRWHYDNCKLKGGK
jgi:hypothetical protein